MISKSILLNKENNKNKHNIILQPKFKSRHLKQSTKTTFPIESIECKVNSNKIKKFDDLSNGIEEIKTYITDSFKSNFNNVYFSKSFIDMKVRLEVLIWVKQVVLEQRVSNNIFYLFEYILDQYYTKYSHSSSDDKKKQFDSSLELTCLVVLFICCKYEYSYVKISDIAYYSNTEYSISQYIDIENSILSRVGFDIPICNSPYDLIDGIIYYIINIDNEENEENKDFKAGSILSYKRKYILNQIVYFLYEYIVIFNKNKLCLLLDDKPYVLNIIIVIIHISLSIDPLLTSYKKRLSQLLSLSSIEKIEDLIEYSIIKESISLDIIYPIRQAIDYIGNTNNRPFNIFDGFSILSIFEIIIHINYNMKIFEDRLQSNIPRLVYSLLKAYNSFNKRWNLNVKPCFKLNLIDFYDADEFNLVFDFFVLFLVNEEKENLDRIEKIEKIERNQRFD